MSGYLTISGEAENTIVIERSRFICDIKGIENEDEAREYIEFIRKKYSLANHNCYAYIADEKGLIKKFSDAGEPQGTAGLPMLKALEGRGIKKAVCVVTRYFGGIKLGTGGLSRAYGGSVSDCLNLANIVSMEKVVYSTLKTDYEGYKKVKRIFEKDILKILNVEYTDKVSINFAIKSDTDKIPSDFYVELQNALSGKVYIEKEESGFFAF